jgi:hypothetical protein
MRELRNFAKAGLTVDMNHTKSLKG